MARRALLTALLLAASACAGPSLALEPPPAAEHPRPAEQVRWQGAFDCGGRRTVVGLSAEPRRQVRLLNVEQDGRALAGIDAVNDALTTLTHLKRFEVQCAGSFDLLVVEGSVVREGEARRELTIEAVIAGGRLESVTSRSTPSYGGG